MGIKGVVSLAFRLRGMYCFMNPSSCPGVYLPLALGRAQLCRRRRQRQQRHAHKIISTADKRVIPKRVFRLAVARDDVVSTYTSCIIYVTFTPHIVWLAAWRSSVSLCFMLVLCRVPRMIPFHSKRERADWAGWLSFGA